MSSTSEARIKEIADRIRALVVGRYGERIIDAADRLGVGEVELSALLQGRVLSTLRLDVMLTRIVRHFGVDPSWLVSGRYDLRSHLAAESERADLIGLRFQIQRLLAGPDWSVAMQPVERADQAPAADTPRLSAEWAEGPPPMPYDPNAERADGRRGRGDEPDR